MDNSLPISGTYTEDDVYLTFYLSDFEDEINKKLGLVNREYVFMI